MMREMRNATVVWSAIAALALVAAGCGPGGEFGSPIRNQEETDIPDILDNPDAFANKTVTVKGQIQKVDDDGKGFLLDNGLGSVIAVRVIGDFKVAKAAQYHLATAEGKITAGEKNGSPTLHATGVVIK